MHEISNALPAIAVIVAWEFDAVILVFVRVIEVLTASHAAIIYFDGDLSAYVMTESLERC